MVGERVGTVALLWRLDAEELIVSRIADPLTKVDGHVTARDTEARQDTRIHRISEAPNHSGILNWAKQMSLNWSIWDQSERPTEWIGQEDELFRIK